MSNFSGCLAATFEKAAPGLPGRGNADVNASRRSALAAFLEAGMPGPRDERWKYTSLRALEQKEFALAGETTTCVIPPGTESRLALGDLEPWRMTFVDGRFDPALSLLDGLPDGVVLERFGAFLEARPAALESLAERGFAGRNDAFALLNTAFVHEGHVLMVPDGVCLQRPVHVVYLGISRDLNLMSHLRNVVQLGRDAEATVIEHWLDGTPASGHHRLTNTVGISLLGQGARLVHLRLQQNSSGALLVDRHDVVQQEASHYTAHTFEFGAQLLRHDLNTRLVAPGARCELNGLYLLGGRQHVDNHTCIDHAAPGCTSSERYKGVLNQRARAVFDGLVLVQPGADGTDARQSNANLLLSDLAEVDTKPQLEIYADEVSCSHGATVGQLDEAALFYLRSRGLDESTARGLLMRGFCMEMINRVETPGMKDVLGSLLDQRLAALGEDGS